MVVHEGKAERYTWRENISEMEIRVKLPTGTKRSELQIALLDPIDGSNLWRTQVETEGGQRRYPEGAILRVRPVFWPEPVIEGVLRGSVDPMESTYEMVATAGGEAWDSLLILLRKAKGSEGLWSGVVKETPQKAAAASDISAGMDAAGIVMRMAANVDSAKVQEECALACCALGVSGKVTELLGARALPQVALAMQKHGRLANLQRAGCALLAAAPIGLNAVRVSCHQSGTALCAIWLPFFSSSHTGAPQPPTAGDYNGYPRVPVACCCNGSNVACPE